MARKRQWSKVKEEARDIVVKERDIGYLDPGIEEIINILNGIPGIATTSSCIGRVTIIEGVVHWGRDGDSRILYKTHGLLKPVDIEKILSRGFRNAWLKATGPILHVRTKTLECALHLLSKARETGFKHSGIISYSQEGGAVVELLSASQMAAPIVINGVSIVKTGSHLELLAGKANSVVEEGRSRLYSLVSELMRNPGPCA